MVSGCSDRSPVRRSPVIHRVLMWCGVLLTIGFLACMTQAVLLLYTSRLPVVGHYELWYMNAEDGWSLIRCYDDSRTVGSSVCKDVARIGWHAGELIVKTGKGEAVRINLADGTVASLDSSHPWLDAKLELGDRPSAIRFRRILPEWVGLVILEVAIGISGIWAVKKFARRWCGLPKTR